MTSSSPKRNNEERQKLVNVNPVVKSLQKLQTLQSQNNETAQMKERDQAKEQEEQMIQRLLSQVKEMRDRVLAHLTSRSRRRIMNELKEQISSMTEIPQLLGRCFNLSLNVKIIGESFEHGYIDSTIGARILSDILILEQSLRLMLSQQPEDLKRSKAMNNLLSLSGLKIDNNQDGRPKLGFWTSYAKMMWMLIIVLYQPLFILELCNPRAPIGILRHYFITSLIRRSIWYLF